MSLDKQGVMLCSKSAAGAAFAGGAGLATAEPIMVGKPSQDKISRKVRVNIRIALIDEFPLRRGSTLNLLRLHVSKATSAFSNADEFFSGSPTHPDTVKCTILSVGGRSVTEAPVAEALRRLKRLNTPPACRPLIVLSDREDAEEVVAAFKAGARGFIPTSLNTALIIAAIHFILAGGTFIPAKLLLRAYRRDEAREIDPAPSVDQVARLDPHQWPPRQLAVLHLLGEGKTNKHIAAALGMEESTVKVHVRHIMRKLGVTNRTEVALYVRRLGLANPLLANAPVIPADSDSRSAHVAA